MRHVTLNRDSCRSSRVVLQRLVRSCLSITQTEKGFDELTFLVQYFDTIEINVTFYRPIPAKTSQAWIRKVEKNKRFRFTGKLWQGFTHDRNASKGDERQFKDGYRPLLEANRLGAILLQFPWSFRNTDENRDYVSRLRGQFDDFR
jgi:uncharacterized protein YecE (DUF72 family)